jgi:hypothetical protein
MQIDSKKLRKKNEKQPKRRPPWTKKYNTLDAEVQEVSHLGVALRHARFA